jgi:hypothetical protein
MIRGSQEGLTRFARVCLIGEIGGWQFMGGAFFIRERPTILIW